MSQRASKVDRAVEESLPKAVDFLADIVACPSVEGAERDAQRKVADSLAQLGMDVSLEPIPECIRSDSEFTPCRALSYTAV